MVRTPAENMDEHGSEHPALEDCAVVFEAADPPRDGRFAFWRPDGTALPARVGEPGELDVAEPDRGRVRVRRVPVVRIPVADALTTLIRARYAYGERNPDPSAAFWGAACLIALDLVARGRLLPGVSDGGFDAWRLGPLDIADMERIRELAAAMPARARAVPVVGVAPVALHRAEGLLRLCLDAIADTMPRTPIAELISGGKPFAALEPQPSEELRDWADSIAIGQDVGVRISLRLEIPGGVDALERGGGSTPVRAVVRTRSLADPTVIVDAVDLWEGGDDRFGPQGRFHAIMAIRRAAVAWAPLERLLDHSVPDELELSDDEVLRLVGDDAASVDEARVEIQWPDEIAHILEARAEIGVRDSAPADPAAFFRGDDRVSLNWRLYVDGDRLDDEDMAYVAKSDRPFVYLKDRWLLLPMELGRKAREWELEPQTPMRALGAALLGGIEIDGGTGPEWVDVDPSWWLAALRDRISGPDSGEEPLVQPAELEATLRDYQLRGLRWLDRMTSLGLNGCLADDMGLGKTITLIALYLKRSRGSAHAPPTLVVCPASLLGNWEREIARFAPGTPVSRFHGPGRTLEEATEGFVLTTYGTMRLDAERLDGVGWDLVVADEAQHVKNPLSATAKALRGIPAAARVALTGTPVENNLSELWAILDWTTPGLLGPLAEFRARWARPVEEEGDAGTAERLSRMVGPFLLRRRKTDPNIVPELPPKVETDRPVGLTSEQVHLYESTVSSVMAEIAGSEGIARRGRVLKLLTGLKQICNHPAQYLKEEQPRLRGRSGKLELLEELLETIVAENDAVLVFTQYVAMARLIEARLRERGLPAQLLHGGTPVSKREGMVRRFQEGEVPVFLLSLKAAGTGLNLTRAGHVVHFDRWWNPAVEEQATDRAYRIGQTRSVQVHRIIAEGTLEDRIASMLRSKRHLADAVLSSGEAALSELSDTELAGLVKLEDHTR
ncbi:DEAD/DEAH box helicase [Nocardiopsis alkaliphila]|uniref:DEAD/DEAH box helicase n=1 Tax=Nocardiopsis alkaliphila TaxID=225762 RepID=UPI0004754E93|nr:DEAD/DEAH box helicase [Nocardiopsis alkaliphila]